METNQSIKAQIVAIIILVIVSALWHPTITKAQSLKQIKNSFMTHHIMTKNLKMNEQTPLNITKLEIKPINSELNQDVDSLKIEIDIDELRQIKTARKKALELEKKKEEERKKAEAQAKADEQARKLTAQSGTSISYDELVNKLNTFDSFLYFINIFLHSKESSHKPEESKDISKALTKKFKCLLL